MHVYERTRAYTWDIPSTLCPLSTNGRIYIGPRRFATAMMIPLSKHESRAGRLGNARTPERSEARLPPLLELQVL